MKLFLNALLILTVPFWIAPFTLIVMTWDALTNFSEFKRWALSGIKKLKKRWFWEI